MVSELFTELEDELMGLDNVGSVRVGVPVEARNAEIGGDDDKLIVYLTFLNLESVDRVQKRKQARVRIMITAYYRDEDQDDANDDSKAKLALEAIDDILQRLADNARQFVLVATPEHTANSIWSSLRVGLRPFLVYECPVSIP